MKKPGTKDCLQWERIYCTRQDEGGVQFFINKYFAIFLLTLLIQYIIWKSETPSSGRWYKPSGLKSYLSWHKTSSSETLDLQIFSSSGCRMTYWWFHCWLWFLMAAHPQGSNSYQTNHAAFIFCLRVFFLLLSSLLFCEIIWLLFDLVEIDWVTDWSWSQDITVTRFEPFSPVHKGFLFLREGGSILKTTLLTAAPNLVPIWRNTWRLKVCLVLLHKVEVHILKKKKSKSRELDSTLVWYKYVKYKTWFQY